MTDHLYYVISHTYHVPDGATLIDVFTDPYYEPAIDRMIYGVVIYDRLLTPQEIAGSGLVSEPRECDPISFADKLECLRKIKGLSQSDLAKIIGVSRSSICNYEKGRRNNITTPTLSAIAQALDVDISELKGGMFYGSKQSRNQSG